MHSYTQQVKNRVRRRVLRHAVNSLTTRRLSTCVVREHELRALVEYALKVLAQIGHKNLRREVHSELDKWLEWQEARVQRRRPEELRIIYLCGPEPMNDLRPLLAYGINPHNVWAVESGNSEFRSAINQLANANIPVKVHNGSLAQFFERVSETFDIAYIDATGPILGGKPLSLAPILEILRSSRLAELSILITNFAEVPKAPLERRRYARLMTEFFRYRYNDVPSVLHRNGVDPAIAEHDPAHMLAVVTKNTDSVYSEFISRFVIDLARSWIPAARGMAAIEKQYISDAQTSTSVLHKAFSVGKGGETFEEIIANMGDAVLQPSGYPLISFVRSTQQLQPPEPLAQQLGNIKFSGKDALSLNKQAALLDSILEGHWELASKELLLALATKWFDGDNRFTCDLALPNLVVNSLLGIYGRPSFCALRDSLRGKYKAKSTEMYTDLFVFDQCRYYFDWFPTVAQLPSRFQSVAFQVIARCILDRIWSSDMSPDAHPFRGSSVAGYYALDAAPFHGLTKRILWK